MLPISDELRRPSHFPVVTVSIIVLNALGFLCELIWGDAFVSRWSLIPADVVAGKHLITLLTSMFLHGSWLHIIGNMVFLWAFGPEVEDSMNPVRYAVFYLLGGIVAMSAQVAVDPSSTIPVLGASGAIAAVMGAFMVTYPRDRIRTIFLLGWIVDVTFVPAALLIGLWFLIQLFNVGVVANTQTGGIAYIAHIGGILFGAATARLFEDWRRIKGEEADFSNTL